MRLVITVSRQLGSLGSYIAARVAEALELRYVDREIIRRVQQEVVPDPSVLEDAASLKAIADRMIQAMEALPLVPCIASATLREAYAFDERVAALMEAQHLELKEARQRLRAQAAAEELAEPHLELMRHLVRGLAQRGDAIILGRGAQVLLQDRRNAVHVRIHAPVPLRIQRLMDREGITRSEAERRVHATDSARAGFLQRVYGYDWEDPTLYHLVLNTGHIGESLAAALIVRTTQEVCQPLLPT